MTQDDRFYVNGVVLAAEDVINAADTHINPDLLQHLKNALDAYNKFELIKVYKDQERSLYNKNRDMYNKIKAARIALEDTLTAGR